MAKNKLHLGAKWIFRINSYIKFLSLWIIVAGILFGMLTNKIFNTFIIYPILGTILITLVCGEIYAQLAYRFWAYEFREDGFRSERGIIWKKYSNIPYTKIQNVDIQRGIFARIFGFSSIMIQTAGYSAQTSSEGYIPAVSIVDAEKIRNFLMKKIGKKDGL
ncbi:MAG: PH domain-containing protein [Candidatus Nanoarchaeia archaeon]|nr:PH domain-containing protein [Candidatus Nanoarchaeia archaeon]MDD5587867.1 PH domain-containing protein [Candidatus Nanoarchaeia archaeon]